MRVRFRSLKTGVAMLVTAVSVLWRPDVSNAQLGRVAWMPPSASLSNHIVAGMVWVDARVWLPDTCKYVGDWATPVQTLPTITVNSKCWHRTGIPCGNVVTSTNHSYQLGYLAPGDYQFVFEAWGQAVATYGFTVPGTDSDADGMSDYQEWVAGTEPLNPNSALRILDCKLEDDQARVTWQGGTSARQYVEWRGNLNGTNSEWLCIRTNHPPTPVTNTWVEPLAGNTTRFYRIRVER